MAGGTAFTQVGRRVLKFLHRVLQRDLINLLLIEPNQGGLS